MSETVPNPGSPTACKQGCRCPVIDNGYGAGAWGTQDKPQAEKLFVFTLGCPVHTFAFMPCGRNSAKEDAP